MLGKLMKWGVFSVLLALVPLGVSWLIQMTHNQNPTLESILAHGELLLITAALCATATGDLIGSGNSLLTGKYVAGGFSLVIVLAAAIYFADIAATLATVTTAQPGLDLGLVADASLAIYVCGVIVSGCCVALSDA
jgi:hypothetical protein